MAHVQLVHKDSVADQIERLHHRIAERAYSLFRERNGAENDPLLNWLAAERELVWTPAIEVREHDDVVTVLAAIPGVDAKDIEVDVTSEDVVVKAKTQHTQTKNKGTIHRCEFVSGEIFRSIALPKRIDPGKVKADYSNGMLRITAPLAGEAKARHVEVSAA